MNKPLKQQLLIGQRSLPPSQLCSTSNALLWNEHVTYFSNASREVSTTCDFFIMFSQGDTLLLLFSRHVQLFATPWTAAHQSSLSFNISQKVPTFMSIESGDANHLILGYSNYRWVRLKHPFLLSQICMNNDQHIEKRNHTEYYLFY